ncbi:MAG: ATP-binding cassette domain-containing protein [Actinobacteria bacterium]|nr:MAG: ATP-binding cassette domain-containing protein [Actinomycetota bacterium]
MEEIRLRTERRTQLVDITDPVRKAVHGEDGRAVLVFVPHTTAGVTINEHADPAVARDHEAALERIVEDGWQWQHVEPGDENAPTHVRASLLGPSVVVPLQPDGRALGVRRRSHVIEVESLTKRFGATLAVDDLSFSVSPGTVTGFLGPNGAGKSTTLRAILGLVIPDAGRTRVLGKSYAELGHPFQQVGAILETAEAHPGRSGRNHLRVLATAAGVSRARVDEVLELVGMTEAAGRRVKNYSLGMRQRLALAGALLGDPETLVLDEPANGLDPQGIRWLRDFLRMLAGEGRTVLVSSHVLAEVAQTVDHVVIIHKGRLVRQAAMREMEAMAAGAAVVRSPDAARFASLLNEAGIDAQSMGDGELSVAAPTARVGELAAANGVVLHELTAARATLEDVFLELTGDEAQ